MHGKPVSRLGNTDAPHSWSYLPDVALALAEVADEERAWGRAWPVPTEPALSTREIAEPLAAVRLPPAVLGVRLRSEFAVRAISVEEQVKATVVWWRERLATAG